MKRPCCGAQIGGLAIIALVLLRLGNGWLFFYEGWHKYNDPKFSSAGYLSQAKGPFAPFFRSKLPDADGRKTLAIQAETNKNDMQSWERTFLPSVEPVKVLWHDYLLQLDARLDKLGEHDPAIKPVEEKPAETKPDEAKPVEVNKKEEAQPETKAGDGEAVSPPKLAIDAPAKEPDRYKLSAEQYHDIEAALNDHRWQLDQWFEGIKPEVEDYFRELAALERQEHDSTMAGAWFQQERNGRKRSELAGKVKPWLDQVAKQTDKYRDDVLAVLNAKQAEAWKHGEAPLLPADPSELQKTDELVTYGVLIIGFCLLTGLFTRLAGLAGALFLAMVIAAQPSLPGIWPPAPPSAGNALLINKEFITLLSLLVLAGVGAGRWGGLDFFLGAGWRYLTRRPAATDTTYAPQAS